MSIYFINCDTVEQLKATYYKLAKQFHPDRGGDLEVMKAINNEYQARLEYMTRHENHQDNNSTAANEKEQLIEFINILNKLFHIGADITIELCGSWLWIGGNTRPHKNELKSMGCRWSSQKRLWYWRPNTPHKYTHRRSVPMETIRFRYGSRQIDISSTNKSIKVT